MPDHSVYLSRRVVRIPLTIQKQPKLSELTVFTANNEHYDNRQWLGPREYRIATIATGICGSTMRRLTRTLTTSRFNGAKP
jgi:hypothetical protein